jgi:hypothetical protein
MKARILGAAALTLGLGACSGLQVNTDYNPEVDFTQYQTFGWAEGAGSGDDARVDNDLVDQRFRRAVELELGSRGMELATSGQPDVFIGYQIILDDRVNYQTVNTYYSSGWGYRGVYGGVGTSQTTARPYTVGTLIIDVYDAGMRELVWRGSGERNVSQSQARSPQEAQERANDVVARILEEFPVG